VKPRVFGAPCGCRLARGYTPRRPRPHEWEDRCGRQL